MTRHFQATVRFATVFFLGFAASGQSTVAATLHSATTQAWNAYVAATEARINAELNASGKFLTTDFGGDDRVKPAHLVEACDRVESPSGPVRDELQT